MAPHLRNEWLPQSRLAPACHGEKFLIAVFFAGDIFVAADVDARNISLRPTALDQLARVLSRRLNSAASLQAGAAAASKIGFSVTSLP